MTNRDQSDDFVAPFLTLFWLSAVSWTQNQVPEDAREVLCALTLPAIAASWPVSSFCFFSVFAMLSGVEPFVATGCAYCFAPLPLLQNALFCLCAFS